VIQDKCQADTHYVHTEDVVPYAILTGREKQVLRYLQKGLPNKQIAGELEVSVKTVEFHLSNIFRKYQVRNRFDLLDLGI
jgi:DNA-binding NarL/FixJ family response regulator